VVLIRFTCDAVDLTDESTENAYCAETEEEKAHVPRLRLRHIAERACEPWSTRPELLEYCKFSSHSIRATLQEAIHLAQYKEDYFHFKYVAS
jgi:hypothetical protein